MLRDSVVMCPNCRTKSVIPENQINRLPTSFATLSVLESMCVECKKMPYSERCHHCSKNLCEGCLAEDPHDQLGGDHQGEDILAALSDVINRLWQLAQDESDVKNIENHGQELMRTVAKNHEERLRKLEKLHKQECAEVEKMVHKEVTTVKTWQSNLIRELKEAQHLMDTTVNLVPGSPNTKSRDRNWKKIELRLEKKLSKLLDVENDKPSIGEMEVKDHSDELEAIFNASRERTLSIRDDHVQGGTSNTGRRPDYKRARFKGEIKAEKLKKIDFSNIVKIYVCETTSNVLLIEQAQYRPNGNKIHFLDKHFLYKFSLPLDGAYGVCELGGLFYVTQSTKNQVAVIQQNGNVDRIIGHHGADGVTFRGPGGITKDRDGLLYISDYGNRCVKTIRPSGECVGSFRCDAFNYYSPLALAVSRSSKKIFVCDFGKNLHILNSSGALERTIKAGNPPHKMHAADVVTDYHGNVIVTDESGRLVVLNEHGAMTCTVGTHGQGDGQLDLPVSTAITQFGDILACDRRNNRIAIWSLPMA